MLTALTNRDILPVALGLLAGVCTDSGLHENYTKKVVRKLLKVKCPIQSKWKATKFQRHLNCALKVLKLHTGWNCRKIRKKLRPIAKTVDSCIDTIAMIKNPMCQINADVGVSECMNTVLDMCDVGRPLPYWMVFSYAKIKNVQKINEGSYGEIYLTKDKKGHESILKFMPIYGRHRDATVDIQVQDVVGDVACSKVLTDLGKPDGIYHAPNFPTIYSVHLVKGKIPTPLLKSWHAYFNGEGERFRSRPRPDRYSDDSIFLVMESDNCGRSFSEATIPGCHAALSFVCQIVAALAVAESACNFEHRDLHMGNVLVKETEDVFLNYSCLRWKFKIKSYGVRAFIIDFTMSRIDYNGRVLFFDMSPLIFTEDDATVDKDNFADHNTLYSKMGQTCGLNWETSVPETNVLWIRHMIENVYQRLLCEIHGEPLSIEEANVLLTLEHLRSIVLDYHSAMDYLVDAVFNAGEAHNILDV